MKERLKDVLFLMLDLVGRGYPKGIKKVIDKERIRKVLIIEVGGIGDLLRVFPAIDAIALNLPDASISILVAKGVKEVLNLYPVNERISEIIDFDLRGLHKGITRKLPLINLIRRRRYDLIYAPARGEGAREIGLMTFLSGAPYRIGFELNKPGGLYTSTVEFKEDIPILRQNLGLLRMAGIKVHDERIHIRIPESDQETADRLVNQSIPNVVAVHTSTARRYTYRMWKPEKYISLIRRIISRFRVTVVLIGSRDEAETGHHISASINNPSVINLIGKTSIPVTAGIISRVRLFIGNDSGPLHIALALGIPSIAIFGPTSPTQVLSEEYRDSCYILKPSLDCSPCYLHMDHRVPSCSSVRCMEQISVDEVMKAVETVLEG